MALDTVVIKITGDSKDLKKTIDQLEKVGKVDRQNAASFKKTSKEQGKALDFIKGKALALGATLLGAFAIQSAVVGAIKILKEFEKELSTLQSITGSTIKEMEFFAKAAKDVGQATKTSATEVVKAFTLIGSAQPELLKNSKALAEVTKQALILAKAAGIDATDAALALTGAMNQFGASAEDAAKFTDIFATSQQKGSSFIAATSEALRMVGASADAVGLSFETTTAAIQALAKGSIIGSQAGTSLNAVLAQLSKQNDDKINPSIVGLSKALEELERRQLSFKEATELVQIEGAKGLLTLIKQRDIFEELDGNLNDVGNAMRQMAINTDNLDGSLDELSNAWEDFVLNLQGSDGIIRTTVDIFTSFLRGMSRGPFIITAFSDALKNIGETTQENIDILESQIDGRKKILESIRETANAEEVAAISASILVLQEKLATEQTKLLAEEQENATNAIDDNTDSTDNNIKSKKKQLTTLALLIKQISNLEKELLNQSLAGGINKKTLDELEVSVNQLKSAEINLQQAIDGGTKSMESQKIAIEGIEEAQVKVVKLTGDTVLSQLSEEEDIRNRLEDKRLEAIDTVSQAEQQAFRIIAQINTNRLIGIDNEEIAQLKSLEAQGLAEEELAVKRLEIQTKADEERAKILTKQAKTDKLAAIFEATIATAVAIVQALPNIPLSILVGVLGAAELAAIAAAPIPTFHEGKKSDLKSGEIYAKILESESVIPPDQSKKYKGAIDSMIDKNFEDYVYKEYMLPMMRSMGKGQHSTPYDDINLYTNQRKQIKLMQRGNALTEALIKSMDSGNKRRSWR